MNARIPGLVDVPDPSAPREFAVRLALPPAELSPNARLHWSAKARYVKQYRTACAWAFVAAKPLGWKVGPVAVDVEFRSHRATGLYHPRDIDNALASTKQVWDAAKDAGILLSDAKRNFEISRFHLLTTEREVERAGGPGIFVTVRRT